MSNFLPLDFVSLDHDSPGDMDFGVKKEKESYRPFNINFIIQFLIICLSLCSQNLAPHHLSPLYLDFDVGHNIVDQGISLGL